VSHGRTLGGTADGDALQRGHRPEQPVAAVGSKRAVALLAGLAAALGLACPRCSGTPYVSAHLRGPLREGSELPRARRSARREPLLERRPVATEALQALRRRLRDP